MMYGYYPWGGAWGAGALGMIFMIVFWIIIITLIVALVRSLSGKRTWRYYQDEREKTGEALEVLKTRYAKGEITKEEFEQKKRDIA